MVHLPAKVNPVSSAYAEYLNRLMLRQKNQQRIIDELKKLCGIKK
jgi:DNA-directed RNA polymerase subunit N (RpoN/RPB10)